MTPITNTLYKSFSNPHLVLSSWTLKYTTMKLTFSKYTKP